MVRLSPPLPTVCAIGSEPKINFRAALMELVTGRVGRCAKLHADSELPCHPSHTTLT